MELVDQRISVIKTSVSTPDTERIFVLEEAKHREPRKIESSKNGV
jgi:hypothetical protein